MSSEQGSIAEAFAKDVSEIKAKLEGPNRLIGYAIVAVMDDGRELVESWSLERHNAGLADDSLSAGIERVIEKLDGKR